MSGLSDSAWEELAAEIDGPAVAEPSPTEPESPEALVQTEPEATTPDVVEGVPAATAEPSVEIGATAEPMGEAAVDPRLAEIERREAALAEREAQEAQRQRELAERIRVMQEQEAEKRSNAYYQQLNEVDPDLAKTYLGMRQSVMQQRREAEGRAIGAEHGLTAAMVALEAEVDPATYQRILARTEQLVSLPGVDQMQSVIQQERQHTRAQSEREAALEQTIKELRLQLDAQQYPAAATVVDGGSSGPGSGQKLSDATDFDTFFGQLTGILPASWQ